MWKKITLFAMLFLFLMVPLTANAGEDTQDDLAKVKNVKLDNSDYKKLAVTWTKVSGADGYEISYSKKESMKDSKRKYVTSGSKTKYTISSLTRKKVYYVRVRAYKEVDGKKVYGDYSAIHHKKVKGKLIVLDAGHQKKANNSKEPIGPGAKTKKAKVSSGTAGIVTRINEYELNLKVAKLLKKELTKRGYDVKMIRTSNNVNISNAQRAKKANKWGADAFIRIHANGSSNHSTHGVLMVSPTKNNPYPVKKLYKKCYNLSSCILKEVCKTTGAKNKGIWQTDTMTGINWCTVPVTILEMGYMSNRSEDKKLAKTSYQKKIVKGVANGLDKYFGR